MFFECYRKKIIGKPCEGEPHARFEVAGDGNGNTAPSLDPTSHGYLPPSVVVKLFAANHCIGRTINGSEPVI